MASVIQSGQKSSDEPPESGLYLLPSPLGNLGDLSYRLVEILKHASLVAAEDTRRTVKLLNHLDLHKPLISYREQNHERVWPKIAAELEKGKLVALLSDAGAPLVSDPGAALVKAVRAAGFPVRPIPGPSAVITALMASGFTSSRFTFGGFLPAKARERQTYLKSLAGLAQVLIFFESPHRLAESLVELAEILGPRPALMAREMTKIHEEYLLLPLDRLAEEVAQHPRRGEITLVIEAPESCDEAPQDLEIYRDEIASDRRPTRVVASEWSIKTGQPRKKVYDLIVSFRNGDRK